MKLSMVPPDPPQDSRAHDQNDPTVAQMLSAKDALRTEMRRVRLSIPVGERATRAGRVTALLLSLSGIRSASVVLGFASFGSEVPTGGLLSALEEAGMTVLLPFLDSGEMSVAPHIRGEPLVRSTYGPAEPQLRLSADPGSIEAVILPGLAFDRRGGRLGYGGGYYDRFLRRLRTRPSLVGIAFAEQLVKRVPVGDGDVNVDLVVTDREVIRCQKGV